MIDIQTFGKKVVALQSVLLKQASAMKPGNVDAQDLVQETLLKLWGMRERLETHPNLEALAIKTLKGIAIDHYRHRQLECEQRLQQPEQATDFTHECELNEELRMVRCVVHQLPPLQQQIFMLKEIEGYEAHEIQTLCGCSPEALRQNLSRARRFVRKELLRISDEMGKK